MKAFLNTKRFWLTAISVLVALASNLIDDPAMRETATQVIWILMGYMAGLFGVEVARTLKQ